MLLIVIAVGPCCSTRLSCRERRSCIPPASWPSRSSARRLLAMTRGVSMVVTPQRGLRFLQEINPFRRVKWLPGVDETENYEFAIALRQNPPQPLKLRKRDGVCRPRSELRNHTAIFISTSSHRASTGIARIFSDCFF